jgi:hypothetical protein
MAMRDTNTSATESMRHLPNFLGALSFLFIYPLCHFPMVIFFFPISVRDISQCSTGLAIVHDDDIGDDDCVDAIAATQPRAPRIWYPPSTAQNAKYGTESYRNRQVRGTTFEKQT